MCACVGASICPFVHVHPKWRPDTDECLFGPSPPSVLRQGLLLNLAPSAWLDWLSSCAPERIWVHYAITLLTQPHLPNVMFQLSVGSVKMSPGIMEISFTHSVDCFLSKNPAFLTNATFICPVSLCWSSSQGSACFFQVLSLPRDPRCTHTCECPQSPCHGCSFLYTTKVCYPTSPSHV